MHLEQEEGRGRGEAAGISWCPVSAEIMGDEAGGADLQLAEWSTAALPASSAQETQPFGGGGVRQQGPENSPHPQISVTQGEARPGEGRGTPIPSLPTQVSSQGPFKLSSTHQVLDSVAPFSQWLG